MYSAIQVIRNIQEHILYYIWPKRWNRWKRLSLQPDIQAELMILK